MVRIIGGRWRRRRLAVPPVAGLRPTGDRVRETLFNWLSPLIEGTSCLDLYAGTGALGFEAASRGAARVVMVERDPVLADYLVEHCRDLDASGVSVVRADATQWLAADRERFDVVFLDPPFEENAIGPLCQRLDEGGRVGPESLIYIERGKHHAPLELPARWSVLRAKRAGRVRYYLARAS